MYGIIAYFNQLVNNNNSAMKHAHFVAVHKTYYIIGMATRNKCERSERENKNTQIKILIITQI